MTLEEKLENISEIEIPNKITEISEILNLKLNQTFIDLNETIQELLHPFTPAIIAVEIVVARNMLAFHTRAHL